MRQTLFVLNRAFKMTFVSEMVVCHSLKQRLSITVFLETVCHDGRFRYHIYQSKGAIIIKRVSSIGLCRYMENILTLKSLKKRHMKATRIYLLYFILLFLFLHLFSLHINPIPFLPPSVFHLLIVHLRYLLQFFSFN